MTQTFSEWLHELSQEAQAEVTAGWRFCWRLAWGIEHFGETVEGDTYQVVAEQTGLARQTLYNKASIGRAFSLERLEQFSQWPTPSHAETVLSLPDDAADELLHLAIQQNWSVVRLRAERAERETGRYSNGSPVNGRQSWRRSFPPADADDVPFSGSGHNFAATTAASVVVYEAQPERWHDDDLPVVTWQTLDRVRNVLSRYAATDKEAAQLLEVLQ